MRLVEATKPDGPRTDACPRQEIERDAVDNPDHVKVSGPSTSANRSSIVTLTGFLAVGAPKHDSEVIVIRGEAKLMIASGE